METNAAAATSTNSATAKKGSGMKWAKTAVEKTFRFVRVPVVEVREGECVFTVPLY